MSPQATDGPLAEPIRRFVEHKRGLHRKYRAEALALRLFDRYLRAQEVRGWEDVDSELVTRFVQSRPRSQPRSYNHLVGVLRRFFAWALQRDYLAANPVQVPLRPLGATRLPFLFDKAEIQRLLALARALPDRSRAPCRGRVYDMVFALLYGLGLRVGEVCRLRCGDRRWRDEALWIAETKFSKSRLVPMGPRLAARLRAYADKMHGPEPATDRPVFSFVRGRCIHPGTISQTFHQLVTQLDLRVPPGTRPPRLHDLRHSFAVSVLLRWYREGVDPQDRLLQLATFLGHVDPASTAVYLHMTDDLLREAERRFRAYAPIGGVA